MADRSSMSISADSPSDETLNRGPLELLLWRQYEFPFGIKIVQFSIFIFLHFTRLGDGTSRVLEAERKLEVKIVIHAFYPFRNNLINDLLL